MRNDLGDVNCETSIYMFRILHVWPWHTPMGDLSHLGLPICFLTNRSFTAGMFQKSQVQAPAAALCQNAWGLHDIRRKESVFEPSLPAERLNPSELSKMNSGAGSHSAAVSPALLAWRLTLGTQLQQGALRYRRASEAVVVSSARLSCSRGFLTCSAWSVQLLPMCLVIES